MLDSRLPASDARQTVDIPLPADRTDPAINRLQIVGVLELPHDTCVFEVANPAQHLTVYGDSVLRFAYAGLTPHPIPVQPDLGRFPWPFFQPNPPTPADLMFVLPQNPTNGELQASAEVSARLGRTAGSKPLTVQARSDSGTLGPDLANANLVYVGQASSLPGLRSLPALPVNISNDGQLSTASGILAPDVGVLLELRSPLNPSRMVLAITGDSTAAVLKAADALTSSLSPTVLHGGFTTVDEVVPPKSSIAAAANDSGAVTLAQLGRGDETFTGPGEHTVSFTFDMPGAIQGAAGLPLRLITSHSPLLDQQLSSVRVSVNGQPLTEIAMKDLGGARATNALLLPAKALRPGQNTIDILFRLRLPAATGTCVQVPDQQAWSVLHADTAVLLPQKLATPPDVTLASYPYPYVNASQGMASTTIVVPDQLTSTGPLLQMLADLGRGTHDGTLAPSFLRAGSAKIEDIRGNCILWGIPGDNGQIDRLARYLPLAVSRGQTTNFDLSSDARLRLGSAADTGVIEEIPSPYGANQFILVVSGTSTKGLLLSVQTLNQRGLDGNLTLATVPPPVVKGSQPAAVGPEQIQLATYDLRTPLTPKSSGSLLPLPLLAAAGAGAVALITTIFVAYEAFVSGGRQP